MQEICRVLREEQLRFERQVPRERVSLVPQLAQPRVGVDRVGGKVEAGVVTLRDREQVDIRPRRDVPAANGAKSVDMHISADLVA